MSHNDPLGLFPRPAANQPQPQSGANTAQPGGLGWLIVGMLLAVALFMGYNRYQDWQQNDDKRGDDQEQVVTEMEGYLIFVHERKELSAAELDMFEAATAFANGIDGLQTRSVDDDDQSQGVRDVIAFAKTKGISPPCLVYKGKQAGEFRNAISYPADLAAMKKVFK